MSLLKSKGGVRAPHGGATTPCSAGCRSRSGSGIFAPRGGAAPPRSICALLRWGCLAALCLGAAASAAQAPLEISGWLDPPGPIWQKPAGRLLADTPGVFAWADADHTLATAPAGTFTFLGLPTWGGTLRVQGDRPTGLEILLFERGDAKALDREAFRERVKDLSARVERWAGTPGRKAADELRSTGVKRESLLWDRDGTRIRLSSSYSSKDRDGAFAFRAEYVRVVCAPARLGAAAPPAKGGTARTEERTNGDRLLSSLPMVDQGDKGYCSVATIERIARYFGLPVDQHELAQLAASDPSAGTDARYLVKALQRVGPRIGLRMRVLDELTVDDALRLLSRYNREARRSGRPAVEAGRVIDLAALFKSMDTELLRAARARDGNGRRALRADILKALADGLPLVWGVVLGKIPETPALAGAPGGHMRLIIGYNERTEEILYSDSWGPGHEEKRMSLDDAWTISTGRYRIEPR